MGLKTVTMSLHLANEFHYRNNNLGVQTSSLKVPNFTKATYRTSEFAECLLHPDFSGFKLHPTITSPFGRSWSKKRLAQSL